MSPDLGDDQRGGGVREHQRGGHLPEGRGARVEGRRGEAEAAVVERGSKPARHCPAALGLHPLERRRQVGLGDVGHEDRPILGVQRHPKGRRGGTEQAW